MCGVVGLMLGAEAGAQGEGLLCAARDVLGRLTTPGDAAGIAVEGDLAYIADGALGLLIVDVSSPGEPRAIGSVDTDGTAVGVTVLGTHTLVASRSAGLVVVDVSDPSAPFVVTGFDIGASVNDVVVRGEIAFVATAGGLASVNVSDPTTPELVGSLSFTGGGSRLAVDGSVAYLSAGSAGMRMIDVTDPVAPVMLATYDPGTVIDTEGAGGMAYVAHSDGLTVLDATDPARPRIVSEFDGFWFAWDDIALAGGRVYVDGGKAVIDVTDPAQPTLVGQCLVRGEHAVIRSGRSFCVGESGLEIVDVADPPESGLLAWLPSARTEGVEIVGDYALLAEGPAGLGIVDISDSSNPIRIVSVDTGGFSMDVAVEGDLAFVADVTQGTGGVRVLDISNPAQPVLLNGPNDWRADRIDVEDGMVGLMGGLLRFIDFSDPVAPVLVGQHTGAAGSRRGHIHMEGGLAYVAGSIDADASFRVFDTSRPADDPIGVLGHTGRALGVDLSRGIACVATIQGMAVLDISDPTVPVVLGTLDMPPGPPEDIAFVGDHALVSLADGPVWLVDLRDAANPRHLAAMDAWRLFRPTVWDIEINEDLAYFVEPLSGLWVFDLSDCTSCAADFNGDGAVNTQDFLAFLTAWADQRGDDCSGGGCSADLNGDGQVTTQDFIEFLNLWALGC